MVRVDYCHLGPTVASFRVSMNASSCRARCRMTRSGADGQGCIPIRAGRAVHQSRCASYRLCTSASTSYQVIDRLERNPSRDAPLNIKTSLTMTRYMKRDLQHRPTRKRITLQTPSIRNVTPDPQIAPPFPLPSAPEIVWVSQNTRPSPWPRVTRSFPLSKRRFRGQFECIRNLARGSEQRGGRRRRFPRVSIGSGRGRRRGIHEAGGG